MPAEFHLGSTEMLGPGMSGNLLLDDGEEKKRVEEDHDAAKQSLDHAWAWFKYHAEQRVATMRFYVVALGGAAAGVGALNQGGQHMLCGGLSAFAALMSFCFLRMDRRSSDLVKFGEEALQFEQARLATATGNAALEICRKSTVNRRPWPYSFGQIMHLLLRSMILAFMLALIYSVASSEHILMLIHGWHKAST
jgi:hypothetical protein